MFSASFSFFPTFFVVVHRLFYIWFLLRESHSNSNDTRNRGMHSKRRKLIWLLFINLLTIDQFLVKSRFSITSYTSAHLPLTFSISHHQALSRFLGSFSSPFSIKKFDSKDETAATSVDTFLVFAISLYDLYAVDCVWSCCPRRFNIRNRIKWKFLECCVPLNLIFHWLKSVRNYLLLLYYISSTCSAYFIQKKRTLSTAASAPRYNYVLFSFWRSRCYGNYGWNPWWWSQQVHCNQIERVLKRKIKTRTPPGW